MVLWRPSRSNTKKRCPFCHRGLEWKRRKSRDTSRTGKFGFGVQNEAGQRLTEFCQENALVIAKTGFQQHTRWLSTWTSPDGQYQNQIDYILWFRIKKGVHQGCILSPCLFNLYAEYIMWNAGLNEAQAGIKIAGRNVNNFRFADDTTLMAESEELESLDETERGEWTS